MKAVVAAFNQEKALVGAFSVITNLRIELFGALASSLQPELAAHFKIFKLAITRGANCQQQTDTNTPDLHEEEFCH